MTKVTKTAETKTAKTEKLEIPNADSLIEGVADPLRESGFHDLLLLAKLWPFVRPYRRYLFLALLLLPLTTATGMIQPFIVRWAIDGPVAAKDFNGLWIYCGYFLAILALNFVCRYYQIVLAQVTGEKIIYDIRTQLYEHLQTLSPRFYHRTPIGKLVTRISSDVDNLSEMLTTGGLSILADMGLIVGAVIGMFLMNSYLALWTVSMLPVVILSVEFFRRRSRQAYDEIRVKVARLNAFVQENLSGMETVQSFRREEKNHHDFDGLNQSILKSNYASVLNDCSIVAVVEFLTYATLLIVLSVGGGMLAAGGDGALQGLGHAGQAVVTFGVLIAFFQFVQMMCSPIEDVSEKYIVIQSGLASIDKIMALFAETPEIASAGSVAFGSADAENLPPTSVMTSTTKSAAMSAATVDDLRGSIAFEDVVFGYRSDRPVLDGMSFMVQPGQKTAVVGPTGAGKTTVMKLLSRFYDVSSGAVKVDGRDVRDWPLAELRRKIVVIQQDDFLFSRTVAENITLGPGYGVDPETDARIEYAAKEANAWSLIQRLGYGADALGAKNPGFQQILEERGRNLSVGERQLLLFARAIYHDPYVLVLDEATSAIDPETEAVVQEAMDRLMAGRTTLVIAHRLSTIRKADQILVMDRGRVVERGSHEALLAENGVYAGFCRYQESCVSSSSV